MIKHIKLWNKWRKYNLNGWFHKFLVLIGFIQSPSLKLWIMSGDEKIGYSIDLVSEKEEK